MIKKLVYLLSLLMCFTFVGEAQKVIRVGGALDTTNIYLEINKRLIITDTAGKWVGRVYLDGDTLRYYVGGTVHTVGRVINSINASNGLNKSGDNLKLGGTLTEGTTLSTDVNPFSIVHSSGGIASNFLASLGGLYLSNYGGGYYTSTHFGGDGAYIDVTEEATFDNNRIDLTPGDGLDGIKLTASLAGASNILNITSDTSYAVRISSEAGKYYTFPRPNGANGQILKLAGNNLVWADESGGSVSLDSLPGYFKTGEYGFFRQLETQLHIGDGAGNSSSGNFNLFIGRNAGAANSGSHVLGIGTTAANGNSHSHVVALGYQAAASKDSQFVVSPHLTSIRALGLGGNEGDVLTLNSDGNYVAKRPSLGTLDTIPSNQNQHILVSQNDTIYQVPFPILKADSTLVLSGDSIKVNKVNVKGYWEWTANLYQIGTDTISTIPVLLSDFPLTDNIRWDEGNYELTFAQPDGWVPDASKVAVFITNQSGYSPGNDFQFGIMVIAIYTVGGEIGIQLHSYGYYGGSWVRYDNVIGDLQHIMTVRVYE